MRLPLKEDSTATYLCTQEIFYLCERISCVFFQFYIFIRTVVMSFSPSSWM